MRLTTTPRTGVLATFLLSTLASTASAAYVQFQDCYDGSSVLRLTPEGLRAALDNSDTVTRLHLNLTGSYSDVKTCDLVPHSNVSANIEITTLTAFKTYTVHNLTTACHETNYPNHDVALLRPQPTPIILLTTILLRNRHNHSRPLPNRQIHRPIPPPPPLSS
ncbi:hypothetical protein CcaCcLH18_10855 [Colletotrichum camelliae]|nr:hypothetical protein CcaCcLH18_10855 [Colletotrichum camelliae]